MTEDVDKKLRQVLESFPREKFDRMMSSRFPCFYCREPSSCLATFDIEGKEIWRYVCDVCYKLLENEDYETLSRRLNARGIIPCEVYYPKPRGEAIQFRTQEELEKDA